jgi:acetyl-CoA carboxylase carboxyltransferase component
MSERQALKIDLESHSKNISTAEVVFGQKLDNISKSIVDNGEYYENMKFWATNIITCFARFDGRSVGIIANQPNVMAGCLDVNASDKSARFISF